MRELESRGGFRSAAFVTRHRRILRLIAVAGLIASFHTIIYAYGRNIYSLSRAGYFPKWLSITHPTRKTPHVALIAGAVLGYVVALLIEYGDRLFGDVPVGAVCTVLQNGTNRGLWLSNDLAS